MIEHTLGGQHLFESEVRGQYGLLILASDNGQQLEAEKQLHRARDIAIQQSAKSLELRAVMSLARLWHQQRKNNKARQLLRTGSRVFTEGFDTADLIEAKQFLRDLESDSL